MNKVLEERIERAKELLRTARHGAMATVNPDGSPHNTPFFMIFDDNFECLYWNSGPDTKHSQNIVRTGQLFLVIYDGLGPGGGLYIQGEQAHELSGQELQTGLEIQNLKRLRENKQPLAPEYFIGESPQRMYQAKLVKFWVNISERDNKDQIIREYRQEIAANDLQ